METVLFIYFLILGMFWFATLFWILIDDEGCYYVNAAVMGDRWTKADLNGWVKMVWLSIFWPLYVTYLLIRYCSIPIIKFIWSALKFGFNVLIYPFKLIFSWIKIKKPSELFSDKIGKFIVKTFKL